MKRTLLVCLLVGGAAFGAGVTAKPKMKFPWVVKPQQVKFNAPCNKTELEWRCLQARVAAPVSLRSWFDVVSLTAVPTKTGLRVKVDLRTKPGVKITKANAGGVLNDTIYFHLRKYVSKNICTIPDDFRNAEIVVSVNGKPAAKRDGGGFVMLIKP